MQKEEERLVIQGELIKHYAHNTSTDMKYIYLIDDIIWELLIP